MLYVFHVNAGRMLTFEMSKALENVRALKETIERHHGIKPTNIVLLINGGDSLVDTNRVCNYPAGTDTNPIFMFSNFLDTKNQPLPCPGQENDTDLKAQVDRCLELPAKYETVERRAKLAQQMFEMAKEETKMCEQLVHEQHLQQQGWAAVVANMEDVIKEFQERVTEFYTSYEKHWQRYKEHADILAEFDKDLEQLAEIPILSMLMENADGRPYGGFDEICADAGSNTNNTESGGKLAVTKETNSASTGSNSALEPLNPSDTKELVESISEAGLTEAEKEKCISLLDWISASEGQSALKRMADECRRGLEQLNKATMDGLKNSIEKVIESSQKEEFKEIKGLETRLCDLENLMCNAKKIANEQNELAQSFQQNQNRANTLGDTSILPDLCASHRSQMMVMLENHRKLRDIRRRCLNCKNELCDNVFKRLRFITHTETRVHDNDSTLLFYHSCLKRLQRHLGIIEQIHIAPRMYVSAVAEVVRRRMYSSSFLRWASDLSCRLLSIHNEEVFRRSDFALQFDGHFLSTLFPGMNDMPPSYATQAPSIFDSSLPVLNKQDLQELSQFLPDLIENMEISNIDSAIEFFSSGTTDANHTKTGTLQGHQTGTSETRVAEGKDSESANNAQVQTKDGCDSETDTEEFEKVGQSPIERRRKFRSKVDTCSMATSTEKVQQLNAETLTEENLGTTRLEVESLKSILRNVCHLSHESISFLREQLSILRMESTTNQNEFHLKLETISRCWTAIQKQTSNRNRETIQRLTVDHELEMNDLRKSIHQKDDEILSLRSDNSTLKLSHIETVSKYESEKKELTQKIDEITEVVSNLEKQLADVDVDKRKAIQDAIDQLERKHKTELESLRCRYKLMTSMDRSPSDTSLEKIEKPDMIDIASHEQLLAQTREDFQKEKENAIKIAIEEERQRWEATLRQQQPPYQQRSITSSPGTPTGSHDVYKRILEEKERQLDELRDKETVLLKENLRYKETIQQLTDPELGSIGTNFKDRVQELEREKNQLIKELEKQHNKPSGGISINSCSKGDTVMIVYNGTYDQYTIVQQAPVLYFLHADSYAALNLPPLESDKVPKVTHCIGLVVEKEYCHARKDNNRYKVSRGTRFYRVKVKPLPSSSSSTCSAEKQSLNKEKSKSSELSRSSSTTTDQSITAGFLIDSFAQTETITSPLMDDSAIRSSTSRDMIDSGVVEQHKSIYKERNISVTDDEDVAFCGSVSGPLDDNDQHQHDQRLRYQSVCEEEKDDLDEELRDTNSNNTTVNFYL